VNNIEVCDVTGAGDTFLSAFAFKFLSSKDIDMAIKFAIRAAEITVQHHGVYAPSLEEIK
jgi:sugar/nucleoside kinase (ribokinase family)